jgi:hypothetical protein
MKCRNKLQVLPERLGSLGKTAKIWKLPLIACLVLCSCWKPALADDAGSPALVPMTPNTSTTASSSPTASLQGGVKKVELNLEKLRDIGLDLKHLLKDVSNLYDEVMIQPVSVITEPELIGDGILISIPVKTVPIGPPAPPRKERVDLAMSEIKPVIDMMKKNVTDFVRGDLQFELPDSVMSQLKDDLTQWVSTVDQIYAAENQLEHLTQGPTYDNYAIAGQATEIENGVKTLEKTRRSIYKIIRKEGKEIAKASREDN